jgi:hypothetical protein
MLLMRPALAIAALILLVALDFARGDAAFIGAARAQSPVLSPSEQAILQTVYGSCMQDGKLGAPGGELENNCRCEAQVTLGILTDAGRKAIESGQPPRGPMFTVDQDGFSRRVIQSCPGVRPILERRICDRNPSGQDCLKLRNALRQMQ